MIADIAILIVMALCVLLGYYRGLIKVAVRILRIYYSNDNCPCALYSNFRLYNK